MGARHNRKRTRSRPRNRISAQKSRSFVNLASPSTISPATSPNQRSLNWHQQYSQWQDRIREYQQTQAMREQQEAEAAEAQRLRIFGGEVGDEVSLCPAMLETVLFLFNGRLDYEDP